MPDFVRVRAENGAEIGIADVCGNGAVLAHRTIVMLTLEHDAGTGFRRLEGDADLSTGMNPDPSQRERRCDRGLKSEQSNCHSDSLKDEATRRWI